MNEALWLGFAFLDLVMVVVIFRYFGKQGLFAMIVFNLILCNIQVLKTIELFGLTTTLGNILYASVFFSTDLLNEHYGREEAKKAVILGFLSLILAVTYMQIALVFIPAASDFAQPHLEAIFGVLPRIVLASMVAYLVSQWHDIWAFHFWKARTGGKHLWLRNNASTLASQFLDTIIFCSIAFLGMFPMEVWIQIVISTYLIKLLVAVLDTPFMYLAARFRPRDVAASADSG
ncbi:MAG: VUT family protein [Desulfovibrionales bacterium]|nr:MAG: VUT family protein [Desulfovibrionales bacterium]